MKKSFLLLLVSFPSPWANDHDDFLDSRPVIVSIPGYGRVQGKRDQGIDFFGAIPYAAPPVGKGRFAPPETPPPWAPAVLDASQYPNDCWQLVDPLLNPNAELEKMSEDCLYLNIYTPAGHSLRATRNWGGEEKLLPVMVWLHGGAFQQGSGKRAEYDGRRLAERDIVVVTINYRLGALGFLVSSADGLYGNFGLMDQRAALHWVHDNIQAFGGDPDRVTLFGESAGAVMTGLHLMMEGTGTLFHKAIMQSNPMGYTFRSVVVGDFIGEALKQSVDCRDLACLQAEPVEEIMRAQSSLMGVPRSVGDFFTWSPTLTHEWKVTLGHQTSKKSIQEHRQIRKLDAILHQREVSQPSWCAVNVSQPLKNLDLIPDEIPIIIGSNKHEGEMFVHSAFPITMSKAVYWMFVGALFRDSASRVLRHYRGYVEELEKEAQFLAELQVAEEENRMFYMDHREQLEEEYEQLLAMNASQKAKLLTMDEAIDTLVKTWSSGGGQGERQENNKNVTSNRRRMWPFSPPLDPESLAKRELERAELLERKARLKEERRKEQAKQRALRDAAKVVVDYRPVMSRIINDYLFRCPSWHYAHIVSRNRVRRGNKNNVYVYRFSQPTHIPGYKECWGKSCHTAELPYVFQAMTVIRTNYSTLSSIAQEEAPSAPEYPYTEILNAYRGAAGADDPTEAGSSRRDDEQQSFTNSTHTRAFQRLLKSVFGDYFKEDADEEIASDMAERWVAFARDGEPNYDGSVAEWLPWRYIPARYEEIGTYPNGESGWYHDEYEYFDDIDLSDEETEEEGTHLFWHDKVERAYRRRALQALSMEVAEEDSFRTELRRIFHEEPHTAHFASWLLFRDYHGNDENKMSKRTIRHVQQIAQEMGVLGTGLHGEDRRPNAAWDDDFFPELLELKWPPEGRLVERDCTCDLWDRIRYRY